MATYEYRCRACGSTFEERRAMADADRPATCPDGHTDTTRLLSVFASSSSSSSSTSAGSGDAGSMAAPAMGGGGCCGGACGCG